MHSCDLFLFCQENDSISKLRISFWVKIMRFQFVFWSFTLLQILILLTMLAPVYLIKIIKIIHAVHEWDNTVCQMLSLTWSLKGRLENTGRFLAHFTDMKSSRAEVSYTFSELDGYRAMWYSEDARSGSLLVTSMFSSTANRKDEIRIGCAG